ncbi:MAG: hypothetical protein WCE50_14645 [Candidatus Acidiferrum sp.]
MTTQEERRQLDRLPASKCLSSFGRLEVKFERELQNSRVASGSDFIEKGTAGGKRGAADWVQVVEGIERFEAELPAQTLCELYVLEHRKVCSPIAGKSNRARPFGRSGGLARYWICKSGGIEPALEPLRFIRVWIAHLICAERARRRTKTIRTGRINQLVRGHRCRKSSLEGLDT